MSRCFGAPFALLAMMLICCEAASRLHYLPLASAETRAPRPSLADVSLANATIFNNASFPYVHMSMICQIGSSQTLVAGWQASHSGEGHADQRIMMALSPDFGRTWGPARSVVGGDGMPVWGPAFFYHSMQQRLYLYFSRSVPENVRESDSSRHYPGGDIYVVTSDDLGASWTEATVRESMRLLLPFASPTRGNISKMTANRPIFLSADQQEWALPFWQEAHSANDTGTPCAGILVTQDGGHSYVAVGEIGSLQRNSSWFIENSLAALNGLPSSNAFNRSESDGGEQPLVLLQVFRTKLGANYGSLSVDGGATWQEEPWRMRVANSDSKSYAAAWPTNGTSASPAELLIAGNTESRGRGLLEVQKSAGSLSSLVARALQGGNGSDVEFSPVVVVANNSLYQWDYPTLLPLLNASTSDDRHSWAVSFSARSHTSVMIAFFDTNSGGGDDDDDEGADVTGAIAITFGIIGFVVVTLTVIVAVGAVNARRNQALKDALLALEEDANYV